MFNDRGNRDYITIHTHIEYKEKDRVHLTNFLAMHFIEVKKKETNKKKTLMKRIARQPLHTIIMIIKKHLAHILYIRIYVYVCMYDIVQHVAGTSNAIARGSDGDRFEKFLRDTTDFRLRLLF